MKDYHKVSDSYGQLLFTPEYIYNKGGNHSKTVGFSDSTISEKRDTMHILDKLRGGNLRSIGRSDEVVGDIEAEPALFDAVFMGLYDDDPCVRMRSADVVEKVTRNHPEYLGKWKNAILNDISRIDQQEVIWHVNQIFPRISWTLAERKKVFGMIKKYLGHKSKIVVVSAMQALAELAEQHPKLKNDTVRLIRPLTLDGSPAMRARGKKLLKQLENIVT